MVGICGKPENEKMTSEMTALKKKASSDGDHPHRGENEMNSFFNKCGISVRNEQTFKRD